MSVKRNVTVPDGSSRCTARAYEIALDDEVDELAGDDDRLARLRAVEERRDALGAARERDELFLAQRRVRLEAVAHLAVHLDDELERVAHELRLVGFGPRLLPQPLVAEDAPQLFRDVRRVRLDQRDRRP